MKKSWGEKKKEEKITPGCTVSATSLQCQSATHLNKKNHGSPSLMGELHFHLSWIMTKKPKQHSACLNWTSVAFYLKTGFIL